MELVTVFWPLTMTGGNGIPTVGLQVSGRLEDEGRAVGRSP